MENRGIWIGAGRLLLVFMLYSALTALMFYPVVMAPNDRLTGVPGDNFGIAASVWQYNNDSLELTLKRNGFYVVRYASKFRSIFSSPLATIKSLKIYFEGKLKLGKNASQISYAILFIPTCIFTIFSRTITMNNPTNLSVVFKKLKNR